MAPTKALTKEYIEEYKDIPEIPFDYPYPSHRGNWCDRQKSDNLREALKGRTISVALQHDSTHINTINGRIDPNDPGLLINLLDRIAKNGKFEWKFGYLNYTAILDKTDNYTSTQLLNWTVHHFDVIADWWGETSQRVEMNITFPTGWYDASIIVIGLNDHSKGGKQNFFNFLWMRPFSIPVWILLIVTLLISGILCYLIETKFIMPKYRLDEFNRYFTDISDHIYMSGMVFTEHMNLKTHTYPGHVVSFSLSFFSMLMISTYTANLAGFLVMKNSHLTGIDGVGDLVKNGNSICIYHGLNREIIDHDYNHSSKRPDLRIKNSEIEVFEGLKNRDCNYAISTVDTWNELKDKKGFNYACTMQRVGEVYQHIDAGFAMKAGDKSDNCTSLVRDVFHVHLLEMHANGEIQTQWEKHLKKNKDKRKNCSTEKSMDELQTLNLDDMKGIFIFQFALVVIAFIFSISGKWYRKWWLQSANIKKHYNQYAEQNVDDNEIQPKRFYSFAPSEAFRESILEGLESERSIDSNVPNKEGYENSFNMRASDLYLYSDESKSFNMGGGADLYLYSDENKRINEVASDMNHHGKRIDELSSNMKLVLQKLDTMTTSEGNNASSFSGLNKPFDIQDFGS